MRNLTGSHCNRFKIGTEQLKRGGLLLPLLQGSSERFVILRYLFLAYIAKVSHNNLICYRPVPLQFAWKDLSTVIFEFDAGHGCDRSMPYMFGIYCIFLF